MKKRSSNNLKLAFDLVAANDLLVKSAGYYSALGTSAAPQVGAHRAPPPPGFQAPNGQDRPFAFDAGQLASRKSLSSGRHQMQAPPQANQPPPARSRGFGQQPPTPLPPAPHAQPPQKPVQFSSMPTGSLTGAINPTTPYSTPPPPQQPPNSFGLSPEPAQPAPAQPAPAAARPAPPPSGSWGGRWGPPSSIPSAPQPLTAPAAPPQLSPRERRQMRRMLRQERRQAMQPPVEEPQAPAQTPAFFDTPRKIIHADSPMAYGRRLTNEEKAFYDPDFNRGGERTIPATGVEEYEPQRDQRMISRRTLDAQGNRGITIPDKYVPEGSSGIGSVTYSAKPEGDANLRAEIEAMKARQMEQGWIPKQASYTSSRLRSYLA